MSNTIKNKIEVNINLPKKDLSGWLNDKQLVKITTIFNVDLNTFEFEYRLPKYIFDAVSDSDDKYITNPPKKEHIWETKPNKFRQLLKSSILSVLLDEISSISSDAIQSIKRQNAETEKYLAIRFTQSSHQQKDGFNFADMGKAIKSEFQFFELYKIIKNENSIDQYNFKSKKRIGGDNYSKNKKWFVYGANVIERNFKLVKYTKERFDFLNKIQNKFIDINNHLELFLGNIDENKIEELMRSNKLLIDFKNK